MPFMTLNKSPFYLLTQGSPSTRDLELATNDRLMGEEIKK